VRELSRFLDHAQRLMAHLSVIRLLLLRRAGELNRPEVAEAMRSAAAGMSELLDPKRRFDENGAAGEAMMGLESLPVEPLAHDPAPWLLRRLQVAAHDARRARRAAREAVTRLVRDSSPTGS
jgi:hypothetical protein